MRHQSRGFRFDLALNVPARFPETLSRALRRAAKGTLDGLPSRLLRVKLDTARTYELSLAVVTKRTIHRLNKTYREKDKPTDVLSFSRLEDAFASPVPEIGDVVICREIAVEQAKAYGAPIAEEYQRLAVHGILHLFGYDHERSEAEARRMFALQRRVLRSLRGGKEIT
jgi:probable rRNA maturation factor